MNININGKARDILEWVFCIIIAVVLAILVRYYVGTPTVVKQSSMYPTLKENQRLVLNRWARTTKKVPERGDIITFESPSETMVSSTEANLDNPIAIYEDNKKGFDKFIYNVLELGKKSFIKRVIALPGDHIKIDNGKVYLNGEELKEEYLPEGLITDSFSGVFTDLTVPENSIFVMGDNRNGSIDSRRFGCVPFDKIESKVVIRFWPLDLFGKIE